MMAVVFERVLAQWAIFIGATKTTPITIMNTDASVIALGDLTFKTSRTFLLCRPTTGVG